MKVYNKAKTSKYEFPVVIMVPKGLYNALKKYTNNVSALFRELACKELNTDEDGKQLSK